MKKKLLITAAAAILSVSSIAGGTMAVYTAATHTDKTISTSSIGVSLNIDEDYRKKGHDNVNTSQRVLKRVSVRNTGEKPQYVRVKINKEWLDKDNVITQRNGEELNKDYIGIDYTNTDDWIYVEPELQEKSDLSDVSGLKVDEKTELLEQSESAGKEDEGYLYYKKIVYPGESTSDFMGAYTVLEGVNDNTNIYSDLSARVDYTAEAIQTVAARAAIMYEWGVIADIADNGEINEVKNTKPGEEYEITDFQQNISDGDGSQWSESNQDTTEQEKNATAISLDSSATRFGVVEKDIDYKEMQPGETREGLVRLYNNSDKKMDFYINSEIIKNIAGEGSKAGIYNIKIYKAMEDKDYELLYDGIISGADESEKHMTDKESEPYILTGDEYLATLSRGESAGIRIFITLDGKSMDNSYMNKQGQLRLNISATQNVITNDTDRTIKTVKTGDNSMLMLFGVLAVVSGVAVLGIIAGLCARRKAKNSVSKEL